MLNSFSNRSFHDTTIAVSGYQRFLGTVQWISLYHQSKPLLLPPRLAVPFELHNGEHMLALDARLLHVLQ